MGTLVKNVKITFEGEEEKYKKEYNFQNIVLTQQLLRPNQLTFTMEKKDLEESASQEYGTTKEVMGAKVVCTIITDYFDEKDQLQQANNSLVFEGIVANINVYRRSGPYSNQMIDVQAFSKDFLLMDHQHCYSYEKETLENIVKQTLEPYDISNETLPYMQDTIPYTVQYNESNYQFLSRLAIRYGEWMFHDGLKWHFGQRENLDPVTLEPHNDILNFRFNTELKHHKVKHAHHDYLAYENKMKSDKDFPDLMQKSYHKLGHVARQKSAKWFTKETFQHLQCSNPEESIEDEVELSIHRQLYGEKARQLVCSCTTVRSDLKIGSIIKLNDFFFQEDERAGNKNLADLIITEIVHYTEVDGEYSNFFTAYPVAGEYPPYFQSDLFPVMSPQRAKVMDNKDPKKLGRIRVQFLWQEEQDPNMMTPWIRIAQPYAGNEKGIFFIPEIDEEVMVDFENGNAEKPFVVGALYHSKQHPRENWYESQDNHTKIIRSRNGHTILFNDLGEGGNFRIYDMDKWNYEIGCSTDEKLICLKSKGNIELYAEKNIIIKAGGNIENYAGWDMLNLAGNDIRSHADNEIYAEAETDVSIYASQEVIMKGDASVSIESDGSIKIEARTTLTEKASSIEESAGTITSEGDTSITIEAPLVEIN